MCYLNETTTKMRKIHDLVNKKGSFDRESLVVL